MKPLSSSLRSLTTLFLLGLAGGFLVVLFLAGTDDSLTGRGSPTARTLLSRISLADTKLINGIEKIYRINFSANRVPATFDPENRDYQESLGILAAIGVIPGVFLFIVGLFFCMGRGCCNCCGGRKAREGCCCVANDKPVFYTKTQRVSTKWVMFLSFVLAACAVTLAYWANEQFSDDVVGFSGIVIQAADGVLTNVTSLRDDMASASLSTSSVDSVIADITSIRNDMRKVDTRVRDQFEPYRRYAMIAVLAVCIFLFFLAIVGGLFNAGGVGFWSLGIFGFLFAFLLGILIGAHISLLVATGDVCEQVVTLLDDPSQTNLPALESLVSCPSQPDLTNVMNDIQTHQTSQLAQLNTYCTGGTCTPSFSLSNFATILDVGSTLNPANRPNAVTAVSRLNSLAHGLAIATDLRSCLFLRQLYGNVEEPVCYNFLRHNLYLLIGIGALFLCFVPGLIVSLLGGKRWKKGAILDDASKQVLSQKKKALNDNGAAEVYVPGRHSIEMAAAASFGGASQRPAPIYTVVQPSQNQMVYTPAGFVRADSMQVAPQYRMDAPPPAYINSYGQSSQMNRSGVII